MSGTSIIAQIFVPLKQYPASGLLFAILDLFQRAKTSVHPVENSIVLLLSLITLNKRKVNNIKWTTYKASQLCQGEKQMTCTNSRNMNTCISATAIKYVHRSLKFDP